MTSAAKPMPIVAGPVALARARGGIKGRWLVMTLAAYLMGSQCLLWVFLGIGTPSLWIAAALIIAVSATAFAKSPYALGIIPWSRLAVLFLVALSLYLLGGEGRYFYANIDWQVRDAVLRDMVVNPWPFVYVPADGQQTLLRAPIGFFLLPALAGKAWGLPAAELFVLLQNSLLLTMLLGLGSLLFADARKRVIALITVLAFSGTDILLEFLLYGGPRQHLEFSFHWLQYSAHITQAFWVPQHALAGWIGALMLLLWHRGMVPLAPMLAILPLTALWSPLALIGVMPFVVWAGLITWRHKKFSARDFWLPGLMAALSAPGLLYLAAAPDAVGARLMLQPWAPWLIFMVSEVLVWAIPLLLWHRGPLTVPVGVATGLLLVLPFANIGWSIDLMMRASIPAILILAVAVATTLGERPPPRVKYWLLTALALGSVTGLHEIARAFAEPPSPRGRCSFYGAWDVSFGNYPKGSHLASIDQVPSIIRPPSPRKVPVDDPMKCWDGRWLRPSGV